MKKQQRFQNDGLTGGEQRLESVAAPHSRQRTLMTSWIDADRIRELERRVAELESDIANAVKYAKLYEPDYPWETSTASEVSWALGSSLQGVAAANKDLHRVLQRLIDDGKVTMSELLAYGAAVRSGSPSN
jgi:hypothetical protein